MNDSIAAAPNPFQLPFKYRWFAATLERLIGLDKLEQCYQAAPKNEGTLAFLQGILSNLEINLNPVETHGRLADVPKDGPLLIVANHPLGGLEGVAITKLLLEIRPDTKVLTNELLTRIPEFQDLFIGVDVLSKDARRANMRGIRTATQHLSSGGALLLFPAGKVASINLRERDVRDHAWNRLAGNLAKKTGATCLPINVAGYNSWFFYALSLIHPVLRTLRLPRELANKRGQDLNLLIGRAITPDEHRHLVDSKAITDYLRISTDLLKLNQQQRTSTPSTLEFKPIAGQTVADDQQCAIELAALEDCRLLETEQFDVYCAPFDRLDLLMEKIGIAREITFRAAGEGTGNQIDSDHFDPHYLHLFVWDKITSRIMGGYRIGRAKEIVDAHGLDGLYSRTLFDFDSQYLDKLENPLEMGRSFVHPDYQRQPKALDLLWRGIGRYVAKNPEFHTLFGAVSISNEHSNLARALISETMLESFCAEQRFLENVRPVAPLKVSGKVWDTQMLASLSHVSVLNKLVGRCDPGKTLPILLRHYISLNGKFVCFSVNKVFNDSLDGLILVDLRTTPKKYLNRYLGKEGSEDFLAKWQSH